MARAKSSSGQRSKKRKYRGNQHFRNPIDISYNSASSKKLKLDVHKKYETEDLFNGYRLFDINILFSEIENNLSCKSYGGSVKLNEDLVHGLASKIKIACQSCDSICYFRNSKMLGAKKNIPEINRRSVYAMRCIGQGRTGLKIFCGVMDMPAPVSEKQYASIICKVRDAANVAATASMIQASVEETAATQNGNAVCISGDGTWKTRGHTSLIGVCTAVGAETGKVIDVEVMSSFCKGCQEWQGEKYGPAYEEWKEEHSEKCTKNHFGSSAKMEVEGMKKIFCRSESERDVRYFEYIGDGDTKTFPEIQKCRPYGSTDVVKIECVSHVKKRMGTRLRKLKNDSRGKKLADNKTISGKGRLTDKLIDKLTSYYGNAIRGNKDSLIDMRRAVWAIFFHSRSTDDEPKHSFCPKGPMSWCNYQRAISAKEERNFKHKNSVPAAVMDEVKTVFRDLSHPDLLKRCLSGRTQNANESLNAVIWKYCPKVSGSGLIIAQIATYEAVTAYNGGSLGRQRIMKELGLLPGQNFFTHAYNSDKQRVLQAEKRASEATLEARRAKRRQDTTKAAVDLKNEGVLYKAGAF